MMEHGLEGTALGTLVMPYCSGLGNLLFVFLVLQKKTGAQEVMTNCLVNNVTNLTFVLGLPALIWGLEILPSSSSKKGKSARAKKSGKAEIGKRLGHLSLLLTMAAVLFFAGPVWALGQDG